MPPDGGCLRLSNFDLPIAEAMLYSTYSEPVLKRYNDSDVILRSRSLTGALGNGVPSAP